MIYISLKKVGKIDPIYTFLLENERLDIECLKTFRVAV